MTHLETARIGSQIPALALLLLATASLAADLKPDERPETVPRARRQDARTHRDRTQ